jgi:hypothetical protein
LVRESCWRQLRDERVLRQGTLQLAPNESVPPEVGGRAHGWSKFNGAPCDSRREAHGYLRRRVRVRRGAKCGRNASREGQQIWAGCRDLQLDPCALLVWVGSIVWSTATQLVLSQVFAHSRAPILSSTIVAPLDTSGCGG